jgi:hypothetical protein
MQDSYTSGATRVRRLVVAAAAAFALATAMSPASAQAATYNVTGTGGALFVRSAPALGAPTSGHLPDGTSIDIICQTRGDQVVGSTMWDEIDQPVAGFVADWYTTTPNVNNPSPGLPSCGSPAPQSPAPANHYPTYQRFDNLGGKVYRLLSDTLAYDPLLGKYVDRNYTFGYWDGHYVYKITNDLGIDINTGQVVVAQTTQHLIILGGAVAGAKACNPPGMDWTGAAWARAVITSWCGAAGAITTFVH